MEEVRFKALGKLVLMFVAVFQSLCHVGLFATPRTAARQATLPFMISRSLLKLLSIESVMPFNYLINEDG